MGLYVGDCFVCPGKSEIISVVLLRSRRHDTDFPFVAKAVGRIHFAGEHTSALRASIEGAIYSGIRAASEVSES